MRKRTHVSYNLIRSESRRKQNIMVFNQYNIEACEVILAHIYSYFLRFAFIVYYRHSGNCVGIL